MALSEEEIRTLEQMERALADEDPKFASTLRGTSLQQVARRRAILAGLVFAVGVTLLMTGAVMRIPAVGVIGFVVMLGSAAVALTALRGRGPVDPGDPAPRETKHEGFGVVDGGRRPKTGRTPRVRRQPASGSFMERMEERWRRRREQGGF